MSLAVLVWAWLGSAEFSLVGFKLPGRSWSGYRWNLLNWAVLGWITLGWVGPGFSGLGQSKLVLAWIDSTLLLMAWLGRNELRFARLYYDGSSWTGLDWAGL